MDYYQRLNLLFVTIGAIALGLYLFLYLKRQHLLQRARQATFKEKHRKLLQKTPHYNNLTDEDKEKIEHSIILFAYTKEFVGVGVDVSEEMKVIIGFYACLLLLHIKDSHCYENLQTIIIYPSAVAIDTVQNSGGIYTKEKFVIEGQSSNNTVIIIWHEARQEAYHLRHNNVIVHEFAHEIDFLDGEIDGIPPIEKSKYHEWCQVLFGDYKKLSEVALKNRDWGRYKLLGAYAATNEAEFFAVVTERFFESPNHLKRTFPELYNELESFYHIDTAALVKK